MRILILIVAVSTFITIIVVEDYVCKRQRKTTLQKEKFSRSLDFMSMSDLNTTLAVALPPKKPLIDAIVLVLSARENGFRRDAIRQTWAKNKSNVFFMVGEACDIPPEGKTTRVVRKAKSHWCSGQPTKKSRNE